MKRVVIIGGTSGIGEGLAFEYVAKDIRVLLQAEEKNFLKK